MHQCSFSCGRWVPVFKSALYWFFSTLTYSGVSVWTHIRDSRLRNLVPIGLLGGDTDYFISFQVIEQRTPLTFKGASSHSMERNLLLSIVQPIRAHQRNSMAKESSSTQKMLDTGVTKKVTRAASSRANSPGSVHSGISSSRTLHSVTKPSKVRVC